MEKRFLIAIVLSFVILFLWQTFFVKKPEPGITPAKAASESPPPESSPLAPEAKPTPPPVSEESRPAPFDPETIQPVAASREQEVIIDTSLYRAIWTNRGAALKSWTLKQHKGEEGEDLELVSSQAQELGLYPFLLSSGDAAFDRQINNALYQPSLTRADLQGGEQAELRFSYADNKGNIIEKIFIFQDGRYDFEIRLNGQKNGQLFQPVVLWGPGFSDLSEKEQKGRFGAQSGAVFSLSEDIERRFENKYDPAGQNAFNYVRWAAYENNYFAAIFILDFQKSSASFLRDDSISPPGYYLTSDNIQKIYIGPKQYNLLDEMGSDTKKIIKFGLFGFIAEILYKAITAIHNVFPNWGLSIIILTIIIKILFFPLTYSSTKSMAKMQELQPKIKSLRAKYKKAKQDIAQRRKMNEEMMKLYKEHGVNPAGGCLPLLIQIPIFWGFFRLLVVSVEFRHAPFMLWISDLSAHDPFYVTPILMGVTQFISQKMTPTSADPTQQRMMYIMPVIMTLLFMNFQSGLVLYWLTNNVLQIGQQYLMNRLRKKQKRNENERRRKR